MTDKTPEQIEIESLRTKNIELLGKLKKAQGERDTAQAALDGITSERNEAQATVTALKLGQPVNAMLERVSLDPDLFATQWGKEYTFALADDAIVIHDKEGNPATLTDDKGKTRTAQFTEDDIRKLADASPHKATYDRLVIASHASGGGATGSRGLTHASPTKPAPTAPTPSPFGLR